jgi:hypothetical protein
MPQEPIRAEVPQIDFFSEGLFNLIQGILSFFGVYIGGAPAGVGEAPVAATYQGVMATLYWWWEIYSIIALLISALFLYGIVYARIRYNELSEKYHHVLHDEEQKYNRLYEKHESHGKLESIEHHMQSDNPGEWRLGIIEADIMLEELLEERGIPGDTIGERLKHLSHDTFHALNEAWEAHKVRNEIAHKGGDFILTKRIANDTIAKYKKAFDELAHGGHGTGGSTHH